MGYQWQQLAEKQQYDPQIGRFLSVDPLAGYGNQDRFSPYAAMWDAPITITDPLGLIPNWKRLFRFHWTISEIEVIGHRDGSPDVVITPSPNHSNQAVFDAFWGGVNAGGYWGGTGNGKGGNYGGGVAGGTPGRGAYTSAVNSEGTLQSLTQSVGDNANENPDVATGGEGENGYNTNYDGKTGEDNGNGGDGQSNNGNNKSPLQDMKDNPPNHPDYKAPKSGARKVRNPNGQGTGWLARDGRVWVPTDHKGTNHAPHYDVETPGTNGRRGPHVNIYPSVSPAVQVGIGVAIGIALWETVKWGGAILGAPETGGASLGLLVLP